MGKKESMKLSNRDQEYQKKREEEGVWFAILNRVVGWGRPHEKIALMKTLVKEVREMAMRMPGFLQVRNSRESS